MSLSCKLYPLIIQRLNKSLAQKAAPRRPEWESKGNFLQGHPKPAFSKKVQRGDQEKFFKNRQKSSPRLKGPKANRANNIILYLVCTCSAKDGKDFGAKSGFKSARMAKLWQFSQGHPKAPFCEKVQRGDQGKFFKNHPKSGPPFKKPTALWRKWHYPLISMHL